MPIPMFKKCYKYTAPMELLKTGDESCCYKYNAPTELLKTGDESCYYKYNAPTELLKTWYTKR